MNLDTLLYGILKVIIRYHNFQIDKHSQKAMKLGLNKYIDNTGSRIKLNKDENIYPILHKLIVETSSLYDNREAHLQCLLTIHQSISEILSNPTEHYEHQIASIKSLVTNYFKAVINLSDLDSVDLKKTVVINSHLLNSLVGQFFLNYGIAEFGNTLNELIMTPLRLSLSSSDEKIEEEVSKLVEELTALVQQKLQKKNSEKEKEELLDEIEALKQQLTAKDGTIKEKDGIIEKQAEEIAKLKKQSGPAKISFADAFTTFPKEPEVTADKKTDSTSEFSL